MVKCSERLLTVVSRSELNKRGHRKDKKTGHTRQWSLRLPWALRAIIFLVVTLCSLVTSFWVWISMALILTVYRPNHPQEVLFYHHSAFASSSHIPLE